MTTELKLIRGFAAVVAVICALRIYSYARERERRGAHDFFDFLSVAIFNPHLVYSPHRYTSQPCPRTREFVRLFIAVTMMPVGWILAKRLIRSDLDTSFWINHLMVLGGFVVVMTAFGQFCLAKWRLRGLRVRPLVDNIVASRTPADFWRRWSWPMHAWLYRYIYVPLGGRRRPVRAVIAVFLFSGLIHEVLFFVAIGRVTGHQTIYFSLNGLGVLASPALEKLSRFGLAGEIMMRGLTISFLGFVAVFMFISLHFGFPLYAYDSWLIW